MFSRCAESQDVPGLGSPARWITVSTSTNCATQASFHSARSTAWISASPRASISSSLNVQVRVEKCARSLLPMLPPAPVMSTVLVISSSLSCWSTVSSSQNVGGTQNLKSSLLVCACSHYCPILVGAPAAIALPSPSHRFARRTVPDGLFRRSYHLQVHICWNTRELCYLQMVQTETHGIAEFDEPPLSQ